MGSTAWNADGDVPVKYSIPWGAVRHAAMRYKSAALAITKLTLGGITYNIGKQATEGLVVVGPGYSSVTFFLPDNREPVEPDNEDGSKISVADWLEMLSTTDYSEIPAWDYFAKFVTETVKSLASGSDADITDLEFSLRTNPENSETVLYGHGDFSAVSTMRELFTVLYESLDDPGEARDVNIEDWMYNEAAAILFTVNPMDEENKIELTLLIGRK